MFYKKLGVSLSLLSVMAWLSGNTPAIAEPICSTEITEIVPQLLEDLPSYGNRVIQRSRKLKREEDTYSYILTASQPDFAPLSLSHEQFTPTVADTTEQIFFSTLEKQHINDATVTFEHHYWLFVTPTENGWAIVHLLNSLNSINQTKIVAPPQDSTQSTIGRATKLWLRDYNARCVD